MSKYFWDKFESLGLLIGKIIFIGTAVLIVVYFFVFNVEEYKPIFTIDPKPTKVLLSSYISDGSVHAFTKSGQEIKSDLFFIKIYFWNNSKDTLKIEDVLSPIIISADDKAQIIDIKPLKYTKHRSDLKLDYLDTIKTGFNIIFKYLAKGDGGIIQVMFEGDSTAKFLINGSIRSFGKVNFSSNRLELNHSPFRIRFLVAFFLALFALLNIYCIGCWFPVVNLVGFMQQSEGYYSDSLGFLIKFFFKEIFQIGIGVIGIPLVLYLLKIYIHLDYLPKALIS